jgi:DNA polymerase I-like protein with 3'-5' exonuclease and polymerase domains
LIVRLGKVLAIKNKQDSTDMLCELDELVIQSPKLSKYKQAMQIDMFSTTCRQTHINWDSPKQVLECFNLLEPMESVNGKYLLKFRNKYLLVKQYIKYKEKSKLANAYGEEFFKFIKSDGKIHTNFNQILATGRVSSSDPNMQQMPSNNLYRNCFIAPKDWVFVSSDYSSQELNVIAYGSKDPVFLQALENGEDLHSVCAELVFGQEWLDASEPDCLYVVS